ncbi:MAG: lactate utilization protein, partial [Anaerolineae bacterium]|nr:lactate utilization protein [Anaerolineae bacterium]
MTFDALASQTQIETVKSNLSQRGVQVEVLADGASALQRIQSMIPAGASVLTGSSLTLTQMGFEDLLKSGEHPWNNLKDELLKAPMEQQYELRRQGTLADFFIASVHAVCETGEVLIASASGSQLPAYAFSSPNVIWVAGTQKIVPTLETGLQRVREYSLPAEDTAQKEMGRPGSFIGKTLIFEREAPYLGRNIH